MQENWIDDINKSVGEDSVSSDENDEIQRFRKQSEFNQQF